MFVLGVAICFAVAAASVFLEEVIPGGLLGASLSINVILSVGKMTFFVMLFTFAMCFGGGSAAAIAPVIDHFAALLHCAGRLPRQGFALPRNDMFFDGAGKI